MGILGLENQSHLIRSFLVSYMLHTLEYKRGYLKENLRGNQIEQLRQDGTYQSVFAQRYAKVLSEFRPNPLLLNYIQSGYLDDEGLRSQICRLNKELKSQHSNAWILYERLAKMEDMDDDEAKTLIDQSLHLLQNNKYNLDELLRLFVLLLQYDHWNIEGFKLTDEIENKFSVSMENLKKTHIYDSTFDAQAPILNEYLSKDSKDRYDSLRNLASRVNRFAKESECQHFIETAEQGDVYALRRYRLEPENAITVNGMDWKKIGKLILTSSNQVACEVCKCIISFTPDAQQLQEDEIISIQDIFLPKLDEYVGSDDKRIRRAFITELRKHLDSIIQAKIGLEH